MNRTLDFQRHRGGKVAAVSLTVLGILVAAALFAVGAGITPTKPLPPETQASIEHAGHLSAAFRHASETILPSVVLIQTYGDTDNRQSTPLQLPPELNGHPLLKRFFDDSPKSLRPHQSPVRGTGSGVIIDASGLILTNHHVVRGGDRVVVRLQNGREYEATEVRQDPQTDLAIVRIEGATDLHAAALGNSDQTQIGDWVLAVGAPFGLKETVTAGIISAKSRGIGITDREDFLQTDAAINPGNSGGPLVNLRGEVIGINTAISSTNGGYQGIGFAIPINLAHWVSDHLVRNGVVQRAYLGVGIQPLTQNLIEQFGLSTQNGVLITDVRADSPAATAGLEPGDVIVAFDGTPIHSPRELQGRVEQAAVDGQHTLEVIRNGQSINVKVSVRPMTANQLSTVAPPASTQPMRDQTLGMTFQDLSEDLRARLGIASKEGVLVTAIEPGSPADQVGLTVPMVIRRVGQQAVSSAAQLQRILEDQPEDKKVLLLIEADGVSRFVVIDPKLER